MTSADPHAAVGAVGAREQPLCTNGVTTAAAGARRPCRPLSPCSRMTDLSPKSRNFVATTVLFLMGISTDLPVRLSTTVRDWRPLAALPLPSFLSSLDGAAAAAATPMGASCICASTRLARSYDIGGVGDWLMVGWQADEWTMKSAGRKGLPAEWTGRVDDA